MTAKRLSCNFNCFSVAAVTAAADVSACGDDRLFSW